MVWSEVECIGGGGGMNESTVTSRHVMSGIKRSQFLLLVAIVPFASCKPPSRINLICMRHARGTLWDYW